MCVTDFLAYFNCLTSFHSSVLGSPSKSFPSPMQRSSRTYITFSDHRRLASGWPLPKVRNFHISLAFPGTAPLLFILTSFYPFLTSTLTAGPVVSDNGNFIIDAPFEREKMLNPYTVSSRRMKDEWEYLCPLFGFSILVERMLTYNQ